MKYEITSDSFKKSSKCKRTHITYQDIEIWRASICSIGTLSIFKDSEGIENSEGKNKFTIERIKMLTSLNQLGYYQKISLKYVNKSKLRSHKTWDSGNLKSIPA